MHAERWGRNVVDEGIIPTKMSEMKNPSLAQGIKGISLKSY